MEYMFRLAFAVVLFVVVFEEGVLMPKISNGRTRFSADQQFYNGDNMHSAVWDS